MLTIIAGTNRPGSSSLKMAIYYQKTLEEKGTGANVLSLSELPDTLIASDLYGKRSPGFRTIQEKLNATTHFVFIIPEYNGSFPGILKTFIDACDFPNTFSGKKASLIGISTGKYGNIRGVEHFTGICHYIGLNVLPLKLHIPAIHKEFDEQGNLCKEDTLKFTGEQIDQIIRF